MCEIRGNKLKVKYLIVSSLQNAFKSNLKRGKVR